MRPRYKHLIASVLIALAALAVTSAADGEVPTAADFAACNDEAPAAAQAGAVLPTSSDRARAGRARAGAMTTGVGNVIESADPQIHGMEAEGAKNATYQAGYRTCMRRKGF